MSKLLSICIPTYNRAEILNRTLNNLEKYLEANIEVVVCDNNSEDNTEKVTKINRSSRIKYFKNSYNRGITYNIIRSLELSKGEYCVLTSDEDDLNIIEIVNCLKKHIHNKPDLIMGSVLNPEGTKYAIRKNKQYKSKKIAFLKHNQDHAYISGLILKRSKIDFKNLWYEFYKPAHGYLNIYPHMYIIKEILLSGNTHITATIFVFRREVGENFIHDNYFLPEQRLIQFSNDLLYYSSKNLGYIYNLLVLSRRYYALISQLEIFQNKFNEDLRKQLNLSIIEYNSSHVKAVKIKKNAIQILKIALCSKKNYAFCLKYFLLRLIIILFIFRGKFLKYHGYLKTKL